VAGGTLPTFSSVISNVPGIRDSDLAEHLVGFTSPENVFFSFRHVTRTLAAGFTDTESFTNVDRLSGSITVFHPIEAEGSQFVVDIVMHDTGLEVEVVLFTWTYTIVVQQDVVLSRTAEPFTLELGGRNLHGPEMPSKLAIGRRYRFNAPAANTSVSISETNARFFVSIQGKVSYRFDRITVAGAQDREDIFIDPLYDTTPHAFVLNRGPSPPSGDVLVDTVTGSIFISPSIAYAVTYELAAFDESGRSASLLRWTFETLLEDSANSTFGPNQRGCTFGTAVDLVEFDSRFTCDCQGSGYEGDNCAQPIALPPLKLDLGGQYIPEGQDPDTFAFHPQTKWAWGRTYQLAPINVTRAFFQNRTSGAIVTVPITFQITWLGTAPSRGFFLDATTAEMLIRIPSESSNNTAQIIATAPGTIGAVAANVTFAILPADVDNPEASGPNGNLCANGGTSTDVYDGESEFDHSYTCLCVGGFGGDNCEEDLAQGSLGRAQSDGGGLVTYTSVGIILFLVVIVIGVSRYQVHRARNRPVDMSAFQDDILASLGLGAKLSVEKDEIGLALHLDPSGLASFINENSIEVMSRDLLTTLRSLSGLPSRLATMLKDKGTAVVIDPTECAVLLRLKRSKTGELRPGTEEAFAAALQRRAEARKISLGGAYFVEEVSVAVPKSVPQELDRHSILRLTALGEGHFGEVYKATITNAYRGNVSLTAAVKTLKTAENSSRTELLREAALMALFDHRNLVAIIGVVTAPRNMPALLVLEFCEHGTLKEHVTDSSPESMNTSVLLTYCCDVACGLSYLSSRKIVHRDIAARNVLLDAAQTCKVSDFGMSASVAGSNEEGDYASNYLRVQGGEFPVRWASIEVLTEARYSKASDVWAFGVLVWEVMTRGARPYAEFATLSEVAERIKSGYTMQCPMRCAKEVYTRAMLPCWRRDPKDRPGFSELCRVLVDMGATPSHPSALMSSTTEGGDVSRNHVDEKKKVSQWKVDLKPINRPLLGPSVHHIQCMLVPKVIAAVKPPWRTPLGGRVVPPESATIADAVDAVIRPLGHNKTCPRDKKIGCAYVDTLKRQDDVGRAIALLSYTWSYKVVSVGAALQRWTEQVERKPKRAYIWICSLCLNQHRIGQRVVSPEDLANEFGPRVQAIGRILPMLEPWRNPTYLTRAWCLFELYTAIGEQGAVDIDIILTEEEDADFLKAIVNEGYGCIDAAFENIRSEEATATGEADLKAIRALVQSKPGGFASLNSTVRHHLGQWFQGHGAVRSAHWMDRKSSDGNVLGSENRMADAASLRRDVYYSESMEQDLVARKKDREGYLEVDDGTLIGYRCTVDGYGSGVVRYVGDLGGSSLHVGVETDVCGQGLSDGTACGMRHFVCKPGHGLFVPPEKVIIAGKDVAALVRGSIRSDSKGARQTSHSYEYTESEYEVPVSEHTESGSGNAALPQAVPDAEYDSYEPGECFQATQPNEYDTRASPERRFSRVKTTQPDAAEEYDTYENTDPHHRESRADSVKTGRAAGANDINNEYAGLEGSYDKHHAALPSDARVVSPAGGASEDEYCGLQGSYTKQHAYDMASSTTTDEHAGLQGSYTRQHSCEATGSNEIKEAPGPATKLVDPHDDVQVTPCQSTVTANASATKLRSAQTHDEYGVPVPMSAAVCGHEVPMNAPPSERGSIDQAEPTPAYTTPPDYESYVEHSGRGPEYVQLPDGRAVALGHDYAAGASAVSAAGEYAQPSPWDEPASPGIGHDYAHH